MVKCQVENNRLIKASSGDAENDNDARIAYVKSIHKSEGNMRTYAKLYARIN